MIVSPAAIAAMRRSTAVRYGHTSTQYRLAPRLSLCADHDLNSVSTANLALSITGSGPLAARHSTKAKPATSPCADSFAVSYHTSHRPATRTIRSW